MTESLETEKKQMKCSSTAHYATSITHCKSKTGPFCFVYYLTKRWRTFTIPLVKRFVTGSISLQVQRRRYIITGDNFYIGWTIPAVDVGSGGVAVVTESLETEKKTNEVFKYSILCHKYNSL